MSGNRIAGIDGFLNTSGSTWINPYTQHNHQENGWFGTHGPAGTRLFTSSLVTHCF
jgi:hypothetical protein